MGNVKVVTNPNDKQVVLQPEIIASKGNKEMKMVKEAIVGQSLDCKVDHGSVTVAVSKPKDKRNIGTPGQKSNFTGLESFDLVKEFDYKPSESDICKKSDI